MYHFPTAWSETSRGAQHLVFSPDNCKLLVATPDYQLVVVDLSESDTSLPFPYTMKLLPKSKSALSYGHHNRGATIRSLVVSPDGQWTVIGDTMNRIHIYHLDSLTVRVI
jgi:WD40 repeat protein